MKKIGVILVLVFLFSVSFVCATYSSSSQYTSPSLSSQIGYQVSKPYVQAGVYQPGKSYSNFVGEDAWNNEYKIGNIAHSTTAGWDSIWGEGHDLGESIIVNVADYEPKIVNVAILEQQDLPVAVYLKGTTAGTVISPFTKDITQEDLISGISSIPPIWKVKVNVVDNPYVKDVNYFPPRQYAYSMSNLGWLSIWLNQIEPGGELPQEKADDFLSEKAKEEMQDSDIMKQLLESKVVRINATAQIHFDLSQSGVFGLNPQTLILKSEPDEDAWLTKINKHENAFFAGRGYIRATSITKNGVSFRLYNSDEGRFNSLIPASASTPYKTTGFVGGGPITQSLVPDSLNVFKLNEGEIKSSIKIANTGNPLEDYISIRVDSVVTPDDRAVFEIKNGLKDETKIVMKNKKLYPNSRWHVESVDKNVLSGGRGNTWLKEHGFSSYALKGLGSTNVNVVEHSVILESDIGEKRKITRYIIEDPADKPTIVPITKETADYLELKYCDNLISTETEGFFSGQKVNKGARSSYACVAVEKLKKFIKEHPSSTRLDEAYFSLMNIYSDYLIDYAACDIINNGAAVRDINSCLEYKGEMDSLGLFYADLLKTDYPYLFAQTMDDLVGAGGEFTIPEEYSQLQLKYVQEKESIAEGSVSYKTNKGVLNKGKIGGFLLNSDGSTVEVNYDGEKYYWKITEIESEFMRIELWDNEKGVSKSKSQKLYLGDLSSVEIYHDSKSSWNPLDNDISVVEVEILEIDSSFETVVTVIPGSGNAYSESNFTIHIPIEERPFSFTPDQIQAQIETTEDIVEKLDSAIEKLESVVKTWKKTCILTFAALTIKNSLFDGGGRVMARKTVGDYYKTNICANNIGWNKEYKTFDDCLLQNEEEISKLIDIEEEAILHANDLVEGKTVDSLKANQYNGEPLADFFNAGGDISEYRDSERFNYIKEKLGEDSAYVKNYLQEGLVGVPIEEKIKSYQAAKTQFDSLKNYKDKAIKQYGSEEKAIQKLMSGQQEAKLNKKEILAQTKQVYGFVPESSNNIHSGSAMLIDDAGNPKDLELVMVPQYAYDIFKEGPSAFEKKAIASTKEKDGAKAVASYLAIHYPNKYATDSKGEFIFVEKKFLKQSSQFTVGKENVRLLVDDTGKLIVNKNLATGAAGTFLTNLGFGSMVDKVNVPTLSFYNTRLPNQYGQVIRTDYASDTLYAEYGEDGNVYCAPTGENGEYIYIFNRYYTGDPNSFEVRNVGDNGLMECVDGGSDDLIVYDRSYLQLNENHALRNTYKNILQKFSRCKEDNQVAANLGGKLIKCNSQQSSIASQLKQPRCTDVMDPSDCKLLFNACDPVMCPTSRCDFGGRYPVDNVVQSGLIGSVMLCLPNKDQGVYMPVCLTGILASLKNIRSVVDDYQECLQTQLDSGKNIGLCSYIRSVGVCQFVWKEAIGIIKMRGGLIDMFSNKVADKVDGGGEYLTFKESLDNVGDSFNYFTTEYQTSFLAYYKGKSMEEVGAQVCEMQVRGKMPGFGEILDKFSEPEDPPQYSAFFSSAPYITKTGDVSDSSVPMNTKELYEYNVIYHIYAGTGFYQEEGVPYTDLEEGTGGFNAIPNQEVSYVVYLQGPGLPPFYVTNEGGAGSTGVLKRRESTTKNVHVVGAKGYNEICMNVQGKKECGFGKVSSSFAINQLNDVMVSEDVKTEITSAEECVPEAPSYSLALGALPIAGRTTPNQVGALSTGLVRVCNPSVPTNDPNRWSNVGVCGKDPNTGLDRGICWLDQSSINIKDLQTKAETHYELYKNEYGKDLTAANLLDEKQSYSALNMLNKERDSMIEQIYQLVKNAQINNKNWLKIQKELWERLKYIAPVKKDPVNLVGPSGTTTTFGFTFSGDWDDVTDSVEDNDAQNLNSYFNNAGKIEGVSPSLLKAIAKFESNFNAKAMSVTGAVGLMQIVSSDPGMQFKKTKCCATEPGEGKKSCLNERKKCKGQSWCNYGGYLCDASNDQRFDATINIRWAARIFKSKMKYLTSSQRSFSIATKKDAMMFSLAAYMEGEGKISQELDKVVLAVGKKTLTWQDAKPYLNKKISSFNANTVTYVEKIAKDFDIYVTASRASKGISGSKLLIIGDSHMNGGLGNYLKTLFEKNQFSVVKKAYDGIGIASWLSDGVKNVNGKMVNVASLNNLIRVNSPNLVIIGLGTNDWSNPSKAGIDAAKLINQIPSGVNCVWVGAGSVDNTEAMANKYKIKYSDAMQINKEISKVVSSKCQFINSMKYAVGSDTSDGVHFTSAGYTKWAQGVFNEISSGSGSNSVSNQLGAISGLASTMSQGTPTSTTTNYNTLKQQMIAKFGSMTSGKLYEFPVGVVTKIKTNNKVVALTLDACSGKYDKDLIDELIKTKTPATLFVNARWIDANEAEFKKLVKNHLFEIANHGMEHRPCATKPGPDLWYQKRTSSVSEALDEFELNFEKLKSYGVNTNYYRSGTAYYDNVCIAMLKDLNYKAINFDVRADDPTFKTDDTKIYNAIMKDVTGGSIILAHMNKPTWGTKKAITKVITTLKGQGYTFITLSDAESQYGFEYQTTNKTPF